MVKVLVNGCNGKMGSIVCDLVSKSENLELVGGFDKDNLNNTKFPVFTNIEEINVKADVIIDFSIPVATLNILKYAVKENIPVVIATTGFTDEQNKEIEECSKKIAIFKSANMSFDITLMKKIVSYIAPILKNTDIEIVETHHNRKIDAPSGTAILLANAINDVLDEKKEYNFERLQKREKRSKNEIGFSSIRGGNIVGEHSVKFFGENEEFEITHKAYSRKVFAEGALKAAKFIVTKETGLYNMNDIF